MKLGARDRAQLVTAGTAGSLSMSMVSALWWPDRGYITAALLKALASALLAIFLWWLVLLGVACTRQGRASWFNPAGGGPARWRHSVRSRRERDARRRQTASRPGHPDLSAVRATIEKGGGAGDHEQAAAQGKLFARERIELLVDAGSFTEDGAFANVLASGLPADGVITGTATIDGRPVALMANDSTVKAGSWGARTVEKIIRMIEQAYGAGLPMIYLVDSAGARITDQVRDVPRPARRGQDLPHAGPGVGLDPAGVRAVRPVGGRRRLHPGVLRFRGNGRRQCLDVSRQPADGRDGGQRADHAGGNGRR